MEIHQHQKNIENDVMKKQIEGGGEGEKFRQESKQDHQALSKKPSSPTPSASSSPTHEFSFTISLNTCSSSSSTTLLNDKSKAPPSSSLALDLSPADDIFFHGHLLPLHFLSHLPSSSRSSTNSMDSFTLPIRDFLHDENENLTKDINSISCSTSNRSNFSIDTNNNTNNNKNRESSNKNIGTTKGEGNNSNSNNKKPKPSFSLFGLSSKGQNNKGCEQVRGEKEEDKEKQKKKLIKFDVIHAVKKYIRVVLFKERKEKIRQSQSQSYSYSSGNVTPRNKQELRGWRGQFSAPASMRTSPTNSGLLLATSALPPVANDSTMEELQAAIQAAIAHCKNSIAKEEKLKC